MRLILLFVLTIFSKLALACDCSSGSTLNEKFEGAQYVFIGWLIKAEASEDIRTGYFTFEVKDAFKGVKKGELFKVSTPMNSCTLSMSIARKYVLYLKDKEGLFNCSGSKDSSYMEEAEWEFLWNQK